MKARGAGVFNLPNKAGGALEKVMGKIYKAQRKPGEDIETVLSRIAIPIADVKQMFRDKALADAEAVEAEEEAPKYAVGDEVLVLEEGAHGKIVKVHTKEGKTLYDLVIYGKTGRRVATFAEEQLTKESALARTAQREDLETWLAGMDLDIGASFQFFSRHLGDWKTVTVLEVTDDSLLLKDESGDTVRWHVGELADIMVRKTAQVGGRWECPNHPKEEEFVVYPPVGADKGGNLVYTEQGVIVGRYGKATNRWEDGTVGVQPHIAEAADEEESAYCAGCGSLALWVRVAIPVTGQSREEWEAWCREVAEGGDPVDPATAESRIETVKAKWPYERWLEQEKLEQQFLRERELAGQDFVPVPFDQAMIELYQAATPSIPDIVEYLKTLPEGEMLDPNDYTIPAEAYERIHEKYEDAIPQATWTLLMINKGPKILGQRRVGQPQGGTHSCIVCGKPVTINPYTYSPPSTVQPIQDTGLWRGLQYGDQYGGGYVCVECIPGLDWTDQDWATIEYDWAIQRPTAVAQAEEPLPERAFELVKHIRDLGLCRVSNYGCMMEAANALLLSGDEKVDRAVVRWLDEDVRNYTRILESPRWKEAQAQAEEEKEEEPEEPEKEIVSCLRCENFDEETQKCNLQEKEDIDNIIAFVLQNGCNLFEAKEEYEEAPPEGEKMEEEKVVKQELPYQAQLGPGYSVDEPTTSEQLGVCYTVWHGETLVGSVFPETGVVRYVVDWGERQEFTGLEKDKDVLLRHLVQQYEGEEGKVARLIKDTVTPGLLDPDVLTEEWAQNRILDIMAENHPSVSLPVVRQALARILESWQFLRKPYFPARRKLLVSGKGEAAPTPDPAGFEDGLGGFTVRTGRSGRSTALRRIGSPGRKAQTPIDDFSGKWGGPEWKEWVDGELWNQFSEWLKTAPGPFPNEKEAAWYFLIRVKALPYVNANDILLEWVDSLDVSARRKVLQGDPLRCKICGKPIKEDTEGDERYCQGHTIWETGTSKMAQPPDPRANALYQEYLAFVREGSIFFPDEFDSARHFLVNVKGLDPSEAKRVIHIWYGGDPGQGS